MNISELEINDLFRFGKYVCQKCKCSTIFIKVNITPRTHYYNNAKCYNCNYILKTIVPSYPVQKIQYIEI